jgi:hypothetical protein
LIPVIGLDVKPQAHSFGEKRAMRSEMSGVPDTRIFRGFGQLREMSWTFSVQVTENNTCYVDLPRFLP